LLASFLIKQKGADDVTIDSRADSKERFDANMEGEEDIESELGDVIDSDTV
jgi:hypothetical protein